MGEADEIRFHQRKSPRLKNYDYGQPNYYFITICTNQKQCLFGNPNQLSAFGRIAHDSFAEIPKHFPSVTVDKFVDMPNRIHPILIAKEPGVTLPLVVGHYKAYVTKQIRAIVPNCKVWQTSFHDHIIRGELNYQRIWEYIDTNPIKWQEDCFYCSVP